MDEYNKLLRKNASLEAENFELKEINKGLQEELEIAVINLNKALRKARAKEEAE